MTGRPISEAFARRAREGRAALVPYVTVGYPRPGTTAELLEALCEAGADVLELGLPFSDPLADGPTIQHASHQALAQGATVDAAFEELARFRARRPEPVVLFSYLNPVLRYGVDAFLSAAIDAGAQGLLITDLPHGADPRLQERLAASGLDLIGLVAPTTPPARVPDVATGSSGFLYYISRTGVTGARASLRDALAAEVASLRRLIALPVAVGFGISTPAQAAAVAAVADGVVVGSALIEALREGDLGAGADFVRSLRGGMDAG